ncbi:MAG: TetR/AcrR family transcriptional regulator [Actinomycetota bacterium]
MPRVGLTTDAVIDAAIEEIDENEVSALTLAAVAKRCGVAAPSLYKHVRDVGHVRSLVAARVIEQLTEVVLPAVTGSSGDEALSGLMRAWRGYVVAHPRRYGAVLPDPLRDPTARPAGLRLLGLLLAVLRGYGLEGPEAVHQARCVRSALHGFVSLEASGGFGMDEDVDLSFERLIDMVAGSLANGGRRKWDVATAGGTSA